MASFGNASTVHFQPRGCVRSLSREALCGRLYECDSSLARDQAPRIRREGRQRWELATAPLRVLAKERSHSAGEEKIATLPGACGWLILKTDPQRSPYLKAHYRASPELKSLAHVARTFFDMIRKRDASLWPGWLQMAMRSPLVSLRAPPPAGSGCRSCSPAATLEQRHGGRADPQIEAVKRQMYGRASFDLLRLRVLHSA